MTLKEMGRIRNNRTMVSTIKCIAVINVKKLPGFKRTPDFGPIANAYHRNKDVLLKQINTYNPDIVLADQLCIYFMKI